MTILLPKVKSFGEQFGEAIGGGFGEGFKSEREKKEIAKQLDKENIEIKKQTGIDLTGITNPEMRKAAFVEQLKGQKPLSDLQIAQKNLAEERTKNLQGQTNFFEQLMGQGQQTPQNLQNQDQIISQEQPNQKKQIDPQNPQTWPEEALKKAAGFKGQPGQTGVIGNIAQAELDRRKESKEKSEKEKIAKRKEEIEFHKESAKYDEELQKNTEIAKKQIETSKTIEKALSSGNIKPASMANILRSFGPIGELAAKALINGDQATLLASIPSLLEGWKQVFGIRLSDADLRILQDKLPDIGKNENANRAIVNVIKKYSDMTLLRSQIANDIKSKNGGLRPLGYANMIEQRFDEMTQMVDVISPRTGNKVSIPAYKVSEALQAGGKLANE